VKEKLKDNKEIDNNQKINKARVAVAVILLSIFGIYIFMSVFKLLSHPTDVFVVEQGKVSEEQLVEGYIIREETVVQGENYKNGMVQIVNEGEKVSKNDIIFRYYGSNEEQLTKKIENLDEKINEAKEKDTKILYSSDIKVIEKDIDNKIYSIHETNDIQKINEYKNEINKLINKKVDIIAKLSPANSYIKKLVDERNKYVTKLNSEGESVKSPASGIVSYKVDGLENVLTTSNFGSY